MQGGEIAITARKFGHDLLLEVADNGPGLPEIDVSIKGPDNGSGVGLVNTRERLAALYDNDFALVLTQNQPRGVKVNIRIPLQLEQTETKDA